MSDVRASQTFLEKIITAYTEIVLKHRFKFLGAIVICVGLSATFIPRLQFDNTPDSFFLQSDDTLKVYENFKATFASDEYSLILLEAPAQWSPVFIDTIRSLQQQLFEFEYVRKVTTILNVRHIKGDAEGIIVDDFIPEGTSVVELEAKRTEAMVHPYYSGLYITQNGRYLGIVVETEIIRGEIDYKIVLARKIREVLDQHIYRDMHPAVVGAPILDADVREIVSRESGLFGGLTFILVAIGFLWVFRSMAGVLLPLSVAILSIVVCFGLMGFAGWPVTLLTPIIPSFMISVGVGSSIFLLTAIYTLSNQQDKKQTLLSVMRMAGIPAMMASITTAGALLAFSVSDIAPVSQVGKVLGLGLLVALCLTMILCPIFFSSSKPLNQSEKRNRILTDRVRLLEKLCDAVLTHSRLIISITIIILILAVIGIIKLSTDYHYLGNFKESTRVRQDYERVDQFIHASSSIEVVFKSNEADAFKEPVNLKALDALQKKIDLFEALPNKTYSLANVVKEIGQALNENNPDFYRIPDQRNMIAQYLILFESSDNREIDSLVSNNYSIARLNIRVPNLPDSHYQPLIEMIQTEAERLFKGTSVQWDVTGLVPMWMKISHYLHVTQVESLLLAVGIVTLVMMIMAKSLVVGLAMALMNGLAVLVILGFMGWLGITLDPYTILIADIAIGILDDDTMHFLKHIQSGLNKGSSIYEAIRDTYRTAGQAMFYMAAVMTFGFSFYVLSSVASLTKFGLLVALTILVGLVIELLLTPLAVIGLYKIGFLKPRQVFVLQEPKPKSA